MKETDCSLTQHANIDITRNGKELFECPLDEFPENILGMTQEVLRQNILLLIDDPEAFVIPEKVFATSGIFKFYSNTLCIRERKGGVGHYLEIRAADAKAAPEALEMVALLGAYLGLMHPEAREDKSVQVAMPYSLHTSARWFKESTLLKDTLDELSAHYGAELRIPAGLGTALHEAVLDRHKDVLLPDKAVPDIDMRPVAIYHHAQQSLSA